MSRMQFCHMGQEVPLGAAPCDTPSRNLLVIPSHNGRGERSKNTLSRIVRSVPKSAKRTSPNIDYNQSWLGAGKAIFTLGPFLATNWSGPDGRKTRRHSTLA
jgi:hypothetical protein